MNRRQRRDFEANRRQGAQQRFAAMREGRQAEILDQLKALDNDEFVQKSRRQRKENEDADNLGFFEQMGYATRDGLQRIDDATQAFVRDNILRLPKDGTELPQDATLSGVRASLGHNIFAARSGYEGDKTIYRGSGSTNDNIGLGLTRALQGGTITAAGLGLANLTNQFGSQADYQEPNQLSL